jgi:hypothetical protein
MKITQMYSITGAVEFLFYNKNLKFVDNRPLWKIQVNCPRCLISAVGATDLGSVLLLKTRSAAFMRRKIY